jgi:hypothetical protein
MYAKLLEVGTRRELLPYLENARIVRVRRGLLVSGTEVVFGATKSKGQRYKQTWICVADPIADGEWPAPPWIGRPTGFDPADDDAE